MREQRRIHLQQLRTGVPGLDRVLDLDAAPGEGGLPEYSFNIIAGSPGVGKTTLTQQIVFANATPERPALYFTVLGESPLKMLRYQQTFSFFDPAKLDRAIRFIYLGEEVLGGDLEQVLETIVRRVEEASPSIVVVDSFRTVVRAINGKPGAEQALQGFVQRLALTLASWQATTFLVGEYSLAEAEESPVFTVADGVLWLTQSVDRNSVVRKLQVIKVRGQASMSGLHTFRITDDGVRVYPRIPESLPRIERPTVLRRLSTGIPRLDEMIGGGIPAGDAVILGGPSGAGKTVIATQFIAEGVRNGEAGVVAIFEEHPHDYERRAKELGFDLQAMVAQGKLEVLYMHPLDLSVDEALQMIREAAARVNAERVVLDSVSGFQLTLAPTFREDFRESLYRLVGALTGSGLTMLMTIEVTDSFNTFRFSAHEVSFLSDDILILRYVELAGRLQKVIAVVKMRGSAHSKELRAYEITDHGVEIGSTLGEYRGLMTGSPQIRELALRSYPGLNEREVTVLQALSTLDQPTVDALAEQTQLQRTGLSAALNRLVALGYTSVVVVDGGKPIYRPTATEAQT